MYFASRIDFTTSNLNDENLNKLMADKIPDVVRDLEKCFSGAGCPFQS